jgi:hypothetical protein
MSKLEEILAAIALLLGFSVLFLGVVLLIILILKWANAI